MASKPETKLSEEASGGRLDERREGQLLQRAAEGLLHRALGEEVHDLRVLLLEQVHLQDGVRGEEEDTGS